MIEVNDLLTGAGQVKDEKALGEFVARVQKALLDLSKDETNREAHQKVAADLKLALEGVKKAQEESAIALEMAKAAARTAPGMTLPDDATLKRIPMLYKVESDKAFAGRMHPTAYNLLSLDRSDIQWLDEPQKKVVERFRYLWNRLVVLNGYHANRGDMAASQAYFARGGWTTLPGADDFIELSKRLQAVAMDESESGGGSQWVPTGVLANLLPDVRPEFELAGYIPVVPLPRSPITLPVLGDYVRGFRGIEATASTGQTQAGTRNVATANMTFTAELVEAMTLYSTQLEDDAIVMLATIVPAELASAIRASVESAWVNGQITGTSLGTSSTFDTGETFVANTDDRHLWDGFRYAASLTGVSYDFGSGLTVNGLNKIRGSMGRWGKSPAQTLWLTGYTGWAKVLDLKDSGGNVVYQTLDKAGAQATAINGTLGTLLGSPLVVSDLYPENLNASGVADGAGSTTSILCVNRMAARHGEVRALRLESSREQFFQFNQVAYKATYRADGQFINTPSSTYKYVGAGVNVPTT